MSHRTLPTVVDRRLLTELLVDVSVGEQVRTKSPAQLLASWVQEPPRWSQNISQLVRDAMPTLHGDEGRVLAWALAEPDTRLRDLVVHGAVLTVEAAELPKPAWGPLWKAATEPPIEMDRRILRRTVARLAEETLTLLGDTGGDLLAGADRVGRASLTPTQLQTSRVLPLAFSDRCHALAQQAAAGKPISSADIVWLTSHRAAQMNRGDLAVIEAMARISRYLDQPFSPKTDLLEQVRDYQRSGAFVDLAIMQLRRALASSVHYHAEARKVLSACRDRRDRENRHFAETLAGGYEGALHREGLTPLHRLWKRTVAPLWQTEPDARLFLVVLDGCSYPVFLELLHSLAQDSAFPLGIKPDASGHVQGLPALSPLPTITSHARGAIFLGELPNDPLVAESVFRDQDEAKTDKATRRIRPSLPTACTSTTHASCSCPEACFHFRLRTVIGALASSRPCHRRRPPATAGARPVRRGCSARRGAPPGPRPRRSQRTPSFGRFASAQRPPPRSRLAVGCCRRNPSPRLTPRSIPLL
jgi:hypothetical protein